MRYSKEQRENIIDPLLGFNDTQTWSTSSGTGSAGLDTNLAYQGNSCLSMLNTAPTTDFVITNATQSTLISFDGDYIASIRLRKDIVDEFLELEMKTFVGVTEFNTQTFTLGSEDTDEDLLLNDRWISFSANIPFTFSKGSVVTFTFNLKGKAGTLLANTTIKIDGFKLEPIDAQNMFPSAYEKPDSDSDNEFQQPVNFVEVNSVSDFPTAVGGVISLLDGYTYKINANTLDLLGDRINSDDAIVNLYGNSSETSSITSTGLGVGIPLISSNTTIKLGQITIKDVDTALDLDKSTVMALDWLGVNFLNIPNLWNIGDFDNMILNLCTISNCNNGIFTGEFGTFAISETPLIGDGNAGSILNFTSTVNCTRRIRIEKNPIVAFGSTIGLTLDNSATIENEQFILNTNVFSGGSTYLGGLDYTSVKSSFKGNTGIVNTNKGGVLTITADAVTVISTQDVWVDLNGTFTLTKEQHIDSPSNGQMRSLDTNTSEYNLTGSLLIDGTAGDAIEVRVSIFRDLTSTFEPQDTFRTIINSNVGGTDFGSIVLFDRITLNENDYVKLEARNTTSTDNFTSEQGSSKIKLTGI
jgi:hypothetical protein